MDQNIIVPLIIFMAITIIAVSAIIKDYKIKVEKIKADVLLKSEEIRAKNRLDIEKLVREDGDVANNKESIIYNDDFDDLNYNKKNDSYKKRI